MLFIIMRIIASKLSGLIKKIEVSGDSVFVFFAYFLFIVLLRNFLEFIYTKDQLTLEKFAHILLSYIWVASSLMVLTKIFFFEENLKIIAKKIFSAMSILVLPPIVDLIISGGRGLYLSYYTPWEFEKVPGFWVSFFTFFGKYRGYGATPGIQVELALGLILSFFYSFFYKDRKFLLSLLYSVSVYLIVMVLGYFPYLFDLLFKWFSIIFHFNHHKFAVLYLFISIFNLVLLLFLEDSKEFKNIIKKIFLSCIFLIFLAAVGFFWANNSSWYILIDQDKIFRLILFFLSLSFAQSFFVIASEKKSSPDLTNWMLIISLVSCAYLGFLSMFFFFIYLAGNYFRIGKVIGGKFKLVGFVINSIAIMSFGQTIILPTAYPSLKNVLFILFLSLILYFIKDFFKGKGRFSLIFQVNR